MTHRIELRHWLLRLGTAAILLGAVAAVPAADPAHGVFATDDAIGAAVGRCAGFGALSVLVATVA